MAYTCPRPEGTHTLIVSLTVKGFFLFLLICVWYFLLSDMGFSNRQ